LIRRVAIAAFALLLAGCGSNPVDVSSQYDYSSVEEYAYSAGGPAAIIAETFVGAVTFEQSEGRSVRIRVVRWADREDDLDLLDVQASQGDSVITVRATNPQELDDVAVDIEITGPPGALLNLGTGVGRVACSGRPGAFWVLDTGVGSIDLSVPADVNISVSLVTGVGGIDVDFNVDGEVSSNRVVGAIGTGDEGSIVGRVGVGSISLGSW